MTSTWDAEPDLTDDGFLGGRMRLWQPRRGYRAGVDPVLLAAAVPATAGQSVLELGCGAGAATLCLATRVPGLRLTGIELQAEYAALARRNAVRNRIDLQVVEADVQNLPPEIRNARFDHVIANPPYYARGHGSASPDTGRDLARSGETPLANWIAIAARRLAPRGWFSMIQRAERLPEILVGLEGRLGSVTVWPLTGRAGRGADRVIVQARKDGRGAFRLLAPLILHEGPEHGDDRPDYTPEIAEVLRHGAALAQGPER